MVDEAQGNQNIEANENSIAFGGISVSGNVGDIRIGHTIGFTSDQVSTLITQISTTFQPKPFDGRSPYKGLDVFEEEDAELFFGREQLVDDLVSRVSESRTVFVTGPSGSGKSSLARAGLIHALKQGAIKGLSSERWMFASLKPGRDPIEAMASALSRLKNPELGNYFRSHANSASVLQECAESILTDRKDQRLVLFIDQFEEVFTQLSPDKAAIFIQLLDCAATVENGRVILLFAMRSDFVPNCATYPQLNALLNRQFVQIGAMQPDELVSAIAQPALRVGLRIDPDLIAQIINDMKGEPGSLPLMQFALKDLFDAQQAQGGMIALTLNDYLQRGGIRKALERHADSSFHNLDSHEQELARSIFTGLIAIGRGTQDTRRTAIFDELVPATANAVEVQSIVRKLADARLITTDEIGGKDIVTISHEKLIEAWPWLKKLVDENREVIALQNEIATAAQEWDQHKRDSSYLYTGARLVNANEQLKANKLVLSGIAFEYIRVGQARQRRRRFTIIGTTIFVIVALLVAVAVFGFLANDNYQKSQQNAALAQQNDKIAKTAQAASTLAVANEQKALEQAQLAQVGELSAKSVALRDTNFQISLLLGIEAYKRRNMPQSFNALFENAHAHSQLRIILNGNTNWVNSIAFSPDGKILASAGDNYTIILWDTTTYQPIGQPLTGHSGHVNSLAFSPDGKTLASGSDDQTIILWDVATRQPVGQPLTGHTDWVSTIAFSPDGKMLASGSEDNSIILWDAGTHQPIGQPLRGHSDTVNSIAFSPDGKTLASGSNDYTIIFWDVATQQPIGQPLTEHTYFVNSVAFSPDGKMLASGSQDGTIMIWNAQTHERIGQPLTEHTNAVNSVAFSPDSQVLASGSDDKSIILWDVATQKRIGQPFISGSSVFSVTFSPDGKTLASNNIDNTVSIWDVSSNHLNGHYDWVNSVAFSPDGKTLASGSGDHTIMLWDVVNHQSIGEPFTGHTAPISSVVFSPDGKILASGSWDKTIILWDVATHQPIGQPLTGHTDTVRCVVFSPDGKILASGSYDNTIILWDVAKRQPIGKPLTGHTDWVNSLAFSPDGKQLASGSRDGTIILWDVATQQSIGDPFTGHTNSVKSVAFSPNGKMLASGSSDYDIILWDLSTHKPVKTMHDNSGAIYAIAFSPDDKMLASGGFGTTINLWDVKTGEPFAQPLKGHTNAVKSIAFSPNGKTLASGSDDTSVILWDIDTNPASLIDKSCQRAGRNLTRAEWTQYFPNETYSQTCEQWPLEAEASALAAVPTAIVAATPTPVATETPVTNSPETFVEKFDGNMDSWTSFMTSGVDRQVDTTLADGRMQIRLSPFEDKVPRVYWLNDSSTYSNVQVEVVATNNGNNANGVSVVCQHNDLGWYEFTVSNAGLYAIYAFDVNLYAEARYIVLANGGSPAIKTGQVTNTYTAVCKGSELSLYVNGTLVNTITDKLLHFTEGKVGFGVSSPQRLPVEIQLESVSVSIPQ